ARRTQSTADEGGKFPPEHEDTHDADCFRCTDAAKSRTLHQTGQITHPLRKVSITVPQLRALHSTCAVSCMKVADGRVHRAQGKNDTGRSITSGRESASSE